MRFQPLVALLASAAVSSVAAAPADPEAAKATGLKARNVSDVDNYQHCPHDNLLRCLIGTPTLAYTFCSWSVGIYATPVTIYETVTVPASRTVAGTTSGTATERPETASTTDTMTDARTTTPSSSPQLGLSDVATVTVTQTATLTVTFDHTQTTTDTAVQTVVQTATIVVTTVVGSESGDVGSNSGGTSSGSHGSESLARSLADTDSLVDATATASTTATATRPTPPPRIDRRVSAVTAHAKPKTSLACLDDLQPTLDSVTSACSCFASSQPTPTATSTVTYVEGAPACPAAQSSSSRNGGSGSQPLQQPTFPNCFADFHPYNCGTDHVGQIACSCALTTEGTAQCTLGDYERDNSCTTSDDCAAGWYCTVIECFGAGVPSVCTKACPVIFAPQPFDGGSDHGTHDATNKDGGAASAHSEESMAQFAGVNELDVSPNHNHNLSIIIVNNDANGFGRGRARGETHR